MNNNEKKNECINYLDISSFSDEDDDFFFSSSCLFIESSKGERIVSFDLSSSFFSCCNSISFFLFILSRRVRTNAKRIERRSKTIKTIPKINNVGRT